MNDVVDCQSLRHPLEKALATLGGIDRVHPPGRRTEICTGRYIPNPRPVNDVLGNENEDTRRQHGASRAANATSATCTAAARIIRPEHAEMLTRIKSKGQLKKSRVSRQTVGRMDDVSQSAPDSVRNTMKL